MASLLQCFTGCCGARDKRDRDVSPAALIPSAFPRFPVRAISLAPSPYFSSCAVPIFIVCLLSDRTVVMVFFYKIGSE
jgi:hypothetical protein